MTEPESVSAMSERMQSLLARAVEDQMSEQRDITDGLIEIRTELSRLAGEVAELRGAPYGGNDLDGQLAAVSADTREAILAMGERLEAVVSMVGQRGEQLSELGAALDGLQGQVQAQGTTLSGLVTTVEALSPQGAGAGGNDGAALTALQSRLDILQTDMTAIGGEVAGLVEGAAADRLNVQAALEAASSAATRSARVDEVANSLDELRLGVAGPDGLSTRVRQLSDDLAEAAGGTDAGVGQLVENAVRDSEQRMRGHVDDAVYALAAALLRRRPAGAPDLEGRVRSEPLNDPLGVDDLGGDPFGGVPGDAFSVDPWGSATVADALHDPVADDMMAAEIADERFVDDLGGSALSAGAPPDDAVPDETVAAPGPQRPEETPAPPPASPPPAKHKRGLFRTKG